MPSVGQQGLWGYGWWFPIRYVSRLHGVTASENRMSVEKAKNRRKCSSGMAWWVEKEITRQIKKQKKRASGASQTIAGRFLPAPNLEGNTVWARRRVFRQRNNVASIREANMKVMSIRLSLSVQNVPYSCNNPRILLGYFVGFSLWRCAVHYRVRTLLLHTRPLYGAWFHNRWLGWLLSLR